MEGTGTALQVQLQTKAVPTSSYVSIYTSSFDCVDDIETIKYYDNHDFDWYPISNAYIWRSIEGQRYYIGIQSTEEGDTGTFRILATKDELPETNGDTTEAPSEETSESGLASDTTDNTVSIAATLSFSFFPNSQVKPPTKDEVDSLMEQTHLFFSQVFQDTYNDAFGKLDLVVSDTVYEEDDILPINITFTSAVEFTISETLPTPQDIFSVMSKVDVQTYIRSYVWQSEPFGSNLFFQTIHVVLEKAQGQSNLEAAPVSAGEEEKAQVKRVDAKGMLLIGFFPYTEVREPTQDEVEALVDQTIDFFTKEFGYRYDDFVRFGALDTSVDFDREDRLPVTVSLDFHVFFSATKQNAANQLVHTPDEVLNFMSEIDLSGYIQNYVWQSKPFSENIFYEAMHVIFRPYDDNDVQPTAPPELSVSQPPVDQSNKVTIHVALSYSFHDKDTAARRAPGATEISGLLNQTNVFFSQWLKDTLPVTSGFSSLRLVAKSMEYKEENEFSVVVYAEGHVFFEPDSIVETHATAQQILALMETADMVEYVEYYVWFAEPVGGVFFSTNQAVLEPYTPDTQEDATSTLTVAPTNQELVVVADNVVNSSATLVRVEADTTLLFAFFPGTDTSQGASPDELDSLTSQTKDFFTKVLHERFRGLVRLDLHLITAGHAEGDSFHSAVVTWKVEALFYLKEPNDGERTSAQILYALRISDIEDYLHNYVWSSKPVGTNYFFNADSVRFEGLGESILETPPSLSPTADPLAPETVAIRATISYGFLPGQVVESKPNGKDLQSILFQTSLFFNKLFRDSYPDTFSSCETGVTNVDVVENAELPIAITYDINVSFQRQRQDDGSAVEVPLGEEVTASMENANFAEYVEFYIWNADPDGNSIFFDTQEVLFYAMVIGQQQ